MITNYRETHVTSWPVSCPNSIEKPLLRLRAFYPEEKTQTHIIHLSTEGEIFPHVDNVDASGTWILGVSLGSPRILRMEKIGDPEDIFDVLLPSGSIYIQR